MRLQIFILLTSLLLPTYTIARGGGGSHGGSSSSSDSGSHSDSDSGSHSSGGSSGSSSSNDSPWTPRMDVLPTNTSGGCDSDEISCGSGCAPQGASCCGNDEFCFAGDYCMQGGCCPNGKKCSSSSSGGSSILQSE
ncbi:hypothetical protein PHISCL_08922, partial [Aspergillus sclerotialis]